MPWDYRSPPKHQSPRFRAKAAYRNMRRRALNASGCDPAYADVQLQMSEDVWLAWALPRYVQFQRERPTDAPCVARIGDKGHYELGNVEIISVVENRTRQAMVLLLRPDGSKLCSHCRIVKMSQDFCKNRARPDGLSHWCRACVRGKRGTQL